METAAANVEGKRVVQQIARVVASPRTRLPRCASDEYQPMSAYGALNLEDV